MHIRSSHWWLLTPLQAYISCPTFLLSSSLSLPLRPSLPPPFSSSSSASTVVFFLSFKQARVFPVLGSLHYLFLRPSHSSCTFPSFNLLFKGHHIQNTFLVGPLLDNIPLLPLLPWLIFLSSASVA